MERDRLFGMRLPQLCLIPQSYPLTGCYTLVVHVLHHIYCHYVLVCESTRQTDAILATSRTLIKIWLNWRALTYLLEINRSRFRGPSLSRTRNIAISQNSRTPRANASGDSLHSLLPVADNSDVGDTAMLGELTLDTDGDQTELNNPE